VCPEHATPSLLLLFLTDEFSENPPFWQRLECPITTPTPSWKRPHPIHQKPLIITRVFMFYRVWVMNWAVPIKMMMIAFINVMMIAFITTVIESFYYCRRCGVAQASFDHPRWCRPHPVFPFFALEA